VFYLKNKAPWEYPDQMLITFCECCHEMVEEAKKGITLYLMDDHMRRGLLNLYYCNEAVGGDENLWDMINNYSLMPPDP